MNCDGDCLRRADFPAGKSALQPLQGRRERTDEEIIMPKVVDKHAGYYEAILQSRDISDAVFDFVEKKSKKRNTCS